MRLPGSCRCLGAGAVLLVGAAWASQQAPAPPKPSATASPAPTRAKPRPRVIQDLSGFELTDPAKLNQETMSVGGTRGFAASPAAPLALAPRLGKLYASDAVFEWSYSEASAKTQFVLSSGAVGEVFRADLEPAQRRYALGGVALEPGKTYQWSIEIHPKGAPVLVSRPAAFVVVSGEERRTIDQSLAGISNRHLCESELARALLFTEHRIWYDALAAYTDVIAHWALRAALYVQRGTIYAQIPVTRRLADEDFDKADEMEARGLPK